eukprot:GFUD01008207.1.p1 GENE.GFUD01008207.1~~GFUD01008207.1.p1  ORF type:complete len:604 (+),score=134.87 GFUD01008207.1:249-2060(+)
MSQLTFNDKVAIVTGAGGGLGRTYALLLASRGAKVVVNDLGGSPGGEGKDTRAADVVVNEIKAAGGIAVPNYDSVEDGEKLVQTALENFGKIDILINNAGILRDKSVVRLSDSDWDLVHRVHLRGAFLTSRAAWPHMKKNKYGRIIMTASVAGIFGNFGQANYSAAKLGLIGLSNTLAIEGGKYGIHSNVIVPMAASRLTKDLLPPDMYESLAPEHISPVVAWMCHDQCEDNGLVVEALAGWAGRYRWQRSQGASLLEKADGKVTPELVRSKWGEIIGMEDADYPTTHQEATMDVLSRIQENMKAVEDDGEKTIKDAIGFVSEPYVYNYSFKESIIYSLAVGVSTRDKDGLRFLYEDHENFAPLPTFGVIPALSGTDGLVTGGVPGLTIDLSKVLHGEQYIKILKPLPAEARLTNTFRIQDILDKGKGMVLLVEVESRDETGDVVLLNQLSIFVVGGGGFGGARTSEHIVDVSTIPSRIADASAEYQTSVDQAALYRMTGDLNPLHISPDFAAMGGFETPILHGLCSFGVAVRQVMEKFADNDPSRVTALKVRFSKPVLPGQKLRTDMWLEGDKVLFDTTVVETGAKCLSGGWVQIARPSSKL